ncbi:hypothetical protein G9F72_004220 [Clostridium estertheticum]|uniref:hypothetical protein n=1 Tax=Clostridium estertheticum TaxID=238834 RepID=UPI0013E98580|nr:hypothetical protein [Clostridium estertheticum]MBZ9685556.1 hypothetical protein [Clostridium estertheticum]
MKETGGIKNDIGSGTCGIDIGTQTVAFISDYDVKLYELAPHVQNIENEKRRILRFILNQQYNKKKLSQRWNYFEYNGQQLKVQRDIYSA